MAKHKFKISNDRNPSDQLFDRVYASYGGRIYNFVMKLTMGNAYLAEEITQMTFLKLWEKRESLHDFEDTLAYLHVVARNIVLNMAEHSVVERAYRDYIGLHSTDVDDSTRQDLDYQFAMDAMMKLVDTMPETRRRVFIMSKLCHKSHKEISAETGISVSTIEKHMIVAMRFLKEQLKSRFNIVISMTLIILDTFTNSIS
jgi:RNA polymerase sigma-70 factor (ECF subfamily)